LNTDDLAVEALFAFGVALMRLSAHDDSRPHGRNAAIFDGPCECDACCQWAEDEQTLNEIWETADQIVRKEKHHDYIHKR
jgi:hypothetical protein